MFRSMQEPSSGSHNQCQAKITGMVPLCFRCERCQRHGAKFRHFVRVCTHTNRSEYVAITLTTLTSTSTVEHL